MLKRQNKYIKQDKGYNCFWIDPVFSGYDKWIAIPKKQYRKDKTPRLYVCEDMCYDNMSNAILLSGPFDEYLTQFVKHNYKSICNIFHNRQNNYIDLYWNSNIENRQQFEQLDIIEQFNCYSKTLDGCITIMTKYNYPYIVAKYNNIYFAITKDLNQYNIGNHLLFEPDNAINVNSIIKFIMSPNKVRETQSILSTIILDGYCLNPHAKTNV